MSAQCVNFQTRADERLYAVLANAANCCPDLSFVDWYVSETGSDNKVHDPPCLHHMIFRPPLFRNALRLLRQHPWRNISLTIWDGLDIYTVLLGHWPTSSISQSKSIRALDLKCRIETFHSNDRDKFDHQPQSR